MAGRMLALLLQCARSTPLAKLPQSLGRCLNGGIAGESGGQRPADLMLSSGSCRPNTRRSSVGAERWLVPGPAIRRTSKVRAVMRLNSGRSARSLVAPKAAVVQVSTKRLPW